MSKLMPMVHAEDVEHIRVCLSNPEEIRHHVQQVTRAGDAPRYNYPGWPADLWGRSAIDITSHMEDRFYETRDPQEYFASMLYLTKRIESAKLFVPWKESANYKALQAKQSIENELNGTNTLPQKTSVLRRRREPYRGLVRRVKYGGKHGRV